MNPLLSIVIANYNYGRFIGEAIQSVFEQQAGADVELIICDAASSDDSVEVIRGLAGSEHAIEDGDVNTITGSLTQWHVCERMTWCSEKDGGQSNAFNKGFSRARGRFLTWLNADDVLLPGSVEKLKATVTRWPDCEWFVGGCFWLDVEMRVVKCFRARGFSEVRYRTGQVSGWGPSTFFTRRLLDCVGGVDERCQYTMDGDLWLKFAAIANARYRPFAKYVWGLRLHEAAKMSSHNFASSGQADPNHPKWRQIDYEGKIRREYFTPTAKKNSWNWFRSIKWGPVLMSRWDTVRFRGKNYKECL